MRRTARRFAAIRARANTGCHKIAIAQSSRSNLVARGALVAADHRAEEQHDQHPADELEFEHDDTLRRQFPLLRGYQPAVQ